MTSQESCEEYRSDDSRILAPELDGVVLCESRDDMSLALKIADEDRVPITPRAGGSGRTRGAVPIEGGLVLACHQMNQMVDFDRKEGVCVVEPGMNLAELHFLVEKEGWFYPPDPNSADLCCLAGNLE
ncbi:MAG: FAD-binding oxidoreductase [Polyangiaceae bacterium]|nr:FAD-binding oxidoreductase [Polyangiaceae bacterium]